MAKKIFLFLLASVIFHATSLYSMAQLRDSMQRLCESVRECVRGRYALSNPCIHFTHTSQDKTLLLNSFSGDAPVKIFNVTYNHTDHTYSLPLNTKNVPNTPQRVTVGEGDLQRLYNGYRLPVHKGNKVYHIFLYLPEVSTDPEERQVGVYLYV